MITALFQEPYDGMSLKLLAAALLPFSLALSACAGTDEASQQSEEVVAAVTEPSEPESTSDPDGTPTPTSDPALDEPTSEPSNDPGEDVIALSEPPVASLDETECAQITFKPRKAREDKGKSYEQLWLFPNIKVKNNCDTTIKTMKFDFYLLDDFGEQWENGYEFKAKMNLKPGKTYRQDINNGYSHYDSNPNYSVLSETPTRELEPIVGQVRLAMAGGEVLEGYRSDLRLE